MSAQVANRLVVLLASAGVFVALVLGIAHLVGAQLPCGASQGMLSGCDRVAQSPVSELVGVPIAFFGLGAYLLVSAGALWREWRGVAQTGRVGVGIWLLLAAGTLVSAGLLSYAWIGLNAVCTWCTASGVIMLLALVAQTAALEGKEGMVRPVPVSVLALLPVVALAAGAVYGFTLKQKAEAVTRAQEYRLPKGAVLAREGNPYLGAADAPVQLVVFADLQCPSCRRVAMMRVLQEVEGGALRGKVRLVYRHFVREDPHTVAYQAAILAEWARIEGKFWQFVKGFLREGTPNQQSMLQVVRHIGLDPERARHLLQNPRAQQPFLQRLQQDRADAQTLGVTFTPTWFVRYPDGKVDRASGSSVWQLLREEAIAQHARGR